MGLLRGVVPIDGAAQKVVPSKLRARLLSHSHYSRLVGYLGGKRMDDIKRREYYWLQMARKVDTTVRVYCGCPRNKPVDKRWHSLQLFLSSVTSEFAAKDPLGSLLKTLIATQLELGMKDLYS